MMASTVARLAAPILLCVAGATQAAGAQDDDLRVIGSHSPAAWRAAVARDLGSNLSTPRPAIGEAPEGMVKVTFSADARRRIDRISVVEPSTSSALDQAAVVAVSRMRTLRAAPSGVDVRRPVQAWIYFANTEATADRYEATLRRANAGGSTPDGRATPLLVGARG